MNLAISLKYVSRLLGTLILLLCVSLCFSLGWSIFEFHFASDALPQGAEVIQAFLIAIGMGILIGAFLFLLGRNATPYLGYREALLLVSLTWFLGAFVAALPFWVWAQLHNFPPGQDQAFISFINCYFEAISGLTTTGATVLSNIESIPNGLLFWRTFTHWIGGLGIVVLFVALLPGVQGETKRLFGLEASGITNQGVTPHIQETARIVMSIYMMFTIVEILLLKIVDFDLSWFQAITHTFSTLGTGGYSNYNSSAGAVAPGVQWVLIAFMFLAGVNFGLYQAIWQGKWKQALANSELKFYVFLIVVSTIVIAVTINGTSYHQSTGDLADKSWIQSIRDSSFQTLSTITTTGFASVNTDEWGVIPKAVIVILMITGGSGGSTAGGIKLIRILGMLKIMMVELEKAFRPNVLRPVKIGTYLIEYRQRISVLAYVLGILFVFGVGTLLLLITEQDISGTTAITASLASVNNIGPGFGAVGSIENYGWFSDAGKIIISLLMVIGRLEIFAVLALFTPKFWKTH